MRRDKERWILAFDASCETCQVVSEAVVRACAGKLEVLPLNHPDVREWRRRALGETAPWAPTLLRTQGDRVRAWTKAAMSVPLARRLGPRSTVTVLQALGQLRHQYNGHPLETKTLGRKQFLRVGAGAAVAAGLVLTGRAPAFAEQAGAWAEQNTDRLPRTYAELIAYPMTYRRAIYARLTPEEASRIWQEHLKHYRSGRPGLTGEQARVLDQLTAEVAGASAFTRRATPYQPPLHLKKATVSAFGQEETRALVSTLGPTDTTTKGAASPFSGCTCHIEDGCSIGYHCRGGNCQTSSSGCGWWWAQTCDGLCYD
ncbi:bacteriocin fulvocin C-related protein [Streptomyces sp. NPDC007100]|uniref:bacteriocin fulvocin C-related protein n=1 Tax=Streptomyces sp. NPDC007100 TaxID=3155602 RepID=UPI003402375B